jgi:hypothetical protein
MMGNYFLIAHLYILIFLCLISNFFEALINKNISYKIRVIARGICRGTAMLPHVCVTVTGLDIIY